MNKDVKLISISKTLNTMETPERVQEDMREHLRNGTSFVLTSSAIADEDNVKPMPEKLLLAALYVAVARGVQLHTTSKGGGINYLNMVVAQEMITCIELGRNSTMGTNIYLKRASPDDGEVYARTKEYGSAWGVDSVKRAEWMWIVL